MAQQTINVGSVPNDGTGDPLRTAYQKINNNFNEIYSNVVGSNFKFTVNTMTTKLGNINISPLGTSSVVVGVNNQLFLSNVANSTNENTGALVVAGGVGIAKDVNIAGNLNVIGTIFGSSIEINVIENSPIGVTTPATGTFTTLIADFFTSNNSIDTSSLTFDSGSGNTISANVVNYDTGYGNSSTLGNLLVGDATIQNLFTPNVNITGGSISGVSVAITSIEDTPVGSITPNTGTFTVMTTSNAQITGGDISGVNFAISSLNGTPVGNATPSTGAFTTLTATTQYDGSTNGAHNGTVGATTANTGKFTTLTATTQYDGAVFGPFNGTVGATTANTGKFTTLTATTQYDGAVFGPINGTIGATTANTGAFTTLTASSTLDVSGTANFAGTINVATVQASNIGNTGATIIGTHNGPINGPVNGTIGATTPNAGTFTSISTSVDSTIGANLTISGNLIATAFDIQGNITGSASSASSATTAGTATYASTAGLASAATTVVQSYQGNITGVGILDNLQVTGSTILNGSLSISDISISGNVSANNLTSTYGLSTGNIEIFGGNLIITNSYTVGSSIGDSADIPGKIVWDSSYIYVCIAPYDGITPIWLRANLTSF